MKGNEDRESVQYLPFPVPSIVKDCSDSSTTFEVVSKPKPLR